MCKGILKGGVFFAIAQVVSPVFYCQSWFILIRSE